MDTKPSRHQCERSSPLAATLSEPRCPGPIDCAGTSGLKCEASMGVARVTSVPSEFAENGRRLELNDDHRLRHGEAQQADRKAVRLFLSKRWRWKQSLSAAAVPMKETAASSAPTKAPLAGCCTFSKARRIHLACMTIVAVPPRTSRNDL